MAKPSRWDWRVGLVGAVVLVARGAAEVVLLDKQVLGTAAPVGRPINKAAIDEQQPSSSEAELDRSLPHHHSRELQKKLRDRVLGSISPAAAAANTQGRPGEGSESSSSSGVRGAAASNTTATSLSERDAAGDLRKAAAAHSGPDQIHRSSGGVAGQCGTLADGGDQMKNSTTTSSDLPAKSESAGLAVQPAIEKVTAKDETPGTQQPLLQAAAAEGKGGGGAALMALHANEEEEASLPTRPEPDSPNAVWSKVLFDQYGEVQTKNKLDNATHLARLKARAAKEGGERQKIEKKYLEASQEDEVRAGKSSSKNATQGSEEDDSSVRKATSLVLMTIFPAAQHILF